MSVYAGTMTPCLRNKNWQHNEVSHLVADTIEELHEFAQKIGLKREWYQHKTMPHYDLTTGKRMLAIGLGAIQIGTRKLVDILQEQRIVESGSLGQRN